MFQNVVCHMGHSNMESPLIRNVNLFISLSSICEGKKRTLNPDKNREQTEQDREFEEQRKAAIKELDQARGHQGGKKFGGTGSKTSGNQDGSSESKVRLTVCRFAVSWAVILFLSCHCI